MNFIIIEHFSIIEEKLLQSPYVIAYKILRQESSINDGKLRIKVTFYDGSTAELFEYVKISAEKLFLSKYSFHWQDESGKLICRWDNAPHYPELPNKPHHKHNSDQSVNELFKIYNILEVLEEIENNLKQCKI